MGINTNKRVVFLLHAVLFFIVLTGCSLKWDNMNQEDIGNSHVTEARQVLDDIGEPNTSIDDVDESNFFGVWSLDKVVLRSNMYSDDISKNGEIIPFDVEDYLGYELEYSANSFRLGEDIYFEPEYVFGHRLLDDYNSGGHYQRTPNFPDLYELIEIENIQVDGAEEYADLGDIPLKYLEVINFEGLEYFKELSYGQIEIEIENNPTLKRYFNPVGRQCVLLNKNTMLVGIWGKIILAHRVE